MSDVIMENTVKLYEKDAYCRSFAAKVVSCTANENGYDIVLDQSAFFPEGGGQKGDTGRLGDAVVTDTQIVGDVIVHKTDKPFETGCEVCGEINWNIRFDRMQNHSAEHIVSGVAYSRFGCSNVGFHLGDDCMIVDFDKKLSAEDIAEIELASNKAVFDNIEIIAIYPTKEEIPTLQYRSKLDIEENLRLIRIGDVDCCACCAPHVAKTGEIGLVKITSFAPYKSGTRIEIAAGYRALADYTLLNNENKTIMKMLSAPRDKTAEFVSRQLEQISAVTKEKQSLVRELAIARLSVTKVGSNGYSFCENCSFDDLRYCSNTLAEQNIVMCVLLSETSENEYIYVISSKELEVTSTVKQLNAAFSGKGGGKPNYAQGKLSGSRNEIEAMLAELLK